MDFTTNNSLNTYTTMIYRHVDNYGNNICEQIENEVKQVVDREITLEQVPHPNLGISVIYPKKNIIDGTFENILLREIDKKDSITEKNQMKIDYNTGKIIVHHDLEGKYLNISYWGMGYNLIHSSRIYTKLDEYGNITETLDDLIKIIINMGDTDYIKRVLQDVENAKVSIINDINYVDMSERLNNIEIQLKRYLDNHLVMNNEISNVSNQIGDVKNIAEDVDYRMTVLENNYLNPNTVSNSEIDIILGGLV